MRDKPFVYQESTLQECAQFLWQKTPQRQSSKITSGSDSCRLLFRQHQHHYGRVTAIDTEQRRYQWFLDNVAFVHSHDKNAGYQITLNQFSDQALNVPYSHIKRENHSSHRSLQQVQHWAIGRGSMNRLNPKIHSSSSKSDDWRYYRPRKKLEIPWETRQPFASWPFESASKTKHYLDGYIVRLKKEKRDQDTNSAHLEQDEILQDANPDPRGHHWKKSVNWATEENPDGVPIVNEAIDQGPCGSCWALAATGTLEASAARHAAYITYEEYMADSTAKNSTKAVEKAQEAEFRAMQTLNLSIQELLDCDTTVDQGCTGGNPLLSFHFIHRYGLVAWEDYPYTRNEGECRSYNRDESRKPLATAHSWALIPSNHERYIELAIRYIGPVAVGVNGGSRSFMAYKGGIFNDPKCHMKHGISLSNNHALLIVGYGEETSNDSAGVVRYWIARNSWGTGWGENGYVRIQRGTGQRGDAGVCGIATNPSVALGGRLLHQQEQELLERLGVRQNLEDPMYRYCKTLKGLRRQTTCLRVGGVVLAHRVWFLGAIAIVFLALAIWPLTLDCRRRRQRQRKRRERQQNGMVYTASESSPLLHEETTVGGSFPLRYQATLNAPESGRSKPKS